MSTIPPRGNPFDSLYITEFIDPASFARVFSPYLVHDTVGLFHPGNVILIGTQGSGKSMLLTLLKPETRAAFARADATFPLEGIAAPFIGAGINLTRSGAIDFGQRSLTGASEDPGVVPAYFADFLNYWIVRDLLDSLELLADPERNPAAKMTGLDASKLDEFARTLARDECWSGAMKAIDGISGLRSALISRIRTYRDFFNYNIDQIPRDVRTSKSSAGEPVAVAAEALRHSGAMSDEVQLFIRIDQYEELGRIDVPQDAPHPHFDRVVHKMLGLRDPRVSYRIGTRRYSWPENPRMLGTAAVLEELRNFKMIDLDEILASQEHRKPFGRFAEDVFRRRLEWAGHDLGRGGANALGSVFGKSLKPLARAELYVKDGSYAPTSNHEWSPSTKELIGALASSDPLAARLAEAYAMQRGEEALVADAGGRYPWETRTWWRKERVGQALLQIAARRRQRMVWSGKDDVLALAGSNILVFVSLCQSIWDAWLRRQDLGDDADAPLGAPEMRDPYVQDSGIQEASRYWYAKIRSDPDGDQRQRFVNLLGPMFRETLREDLQMSNPGHNGFSLDVTELEADHEVLAFLREAAAFGVLVDRLHSTRTKGRGRRQKWYLAPIYSPYFQIPVAHVKEPKYVRIDEVRRWLEDASVLAPAPGPTPSRPRRRRDGDQSRLFE
jgi:hypothetical protein